MQKKLHRVSPGWIPVLLAVMVVAVYGRSVGYPFIALDDGLYITKNSAVHGGITAKGIAWAFSTFRAGNWHPLTWISFQADAALWGLNAYGFHLVNLMFHLINTILLFRLIWKITGNPFESFFVAALFAVHPLRVESVVWISSRKDLLCAFFWIVTLETYLWYTKRPSVPRYLVVVLGFALSLLAKPMAVTLPFVFLLMDFWPLGRLSSTGRPESVMWSKASVSFVFLEKIPLFIIAGLAAVVAVVAQDQAGALATLPIFSKLANSLVAYCAYIVKTFYPYSLAVYYPYPSADALNVSKVAGAISFLAIVTFVAIRTARLHPHMLVGWFWYIGTLVPVIGFVQVGGQSMADRYTYLPHIGLFLMVVISVSELIKKYNIPQWPKITIGSLLLLVVMIRASIQVGYWKDSVTLFTHTLAVTERNVVIHNNLGAFLEGEGYLDEAVAHFREAIKLQPDYAEAHDNLGLVLGKQGSWNEACDHFRIALSLRPRSSRTHNHLGVILDRQGKTREAISWYDNAIRLNPEYAEAYYNRGVALLRQDRVEEAFEDFRMALQVLPEYAEAHNNIGVILLRQGRLSDAIAHFREALRIRPGYHGAQYNLNRALTESAVRMQGERGGTNDKPRVFPGGDSWPD